MMTNNYFLDMIRDLRRQEEIILYGNMLSVADKESADVVTFLKAEYEKESAEYPFTVPAFDPEAALWAAKIIYFAAQLILYRENEEVDLPQFFLEFTGDLNPSAILSSDMCLRFLPDIVTELKIIDNEDPLIEVLENKLYQFHYSGIPYALETERLLFENIINDPTVQQLYINRIIEYKRLPLAKHPACKDLVMASMGIYAGEFWNALKQEISLHE